MHSCIHQNSPTQFTQISCIDFKLTEKLQKTVYTDISIILNNTFVVTRLFTQSSINGCELTKKRTEIRKPFCFSFENSDFHSTVTLACFLPKDLDARFEWWPSTNLKQNSSTVMPLPRTWVRYTGSLSECRLQIFLISFNVLRTAATDWPSIADVITRFLLALVIVVDSGSFVADMVTITMMLSTVFEQLLLYLVLLEHVFFFFVSSLFCWCFFSVVSAQSRCRHFLSCL